MASQRTDINTGVSKGSLFSPTCFLIYINDLPKKNLRFLVSIYADDSTVYWCPSKYLGNQCLPVDLALIAQWEKNWLPITFHHHHHHHQADLKPAPILMSDHTFKETPCLECKGCWKNGQFIVLFQKIPNSCCHTLSLHNLDQTKHGVLLSHLRW